MIRMAQDLEEMDEKIMKKGKDQNEESASAGIGGLRDDDPLPELILNQSIRQQSPEEKVLREEEVLTLPADPGNPSHFTINTLVWVEAHEGHPHYGTIRWLGALPGYGGYFAGVELVSFLEDET